MTREQLTGKYLRLRSELDAARGEPRWDSTRTGRIERIVNELAELERALAELPRPSTAPATEIPDAH